MNKWAWSLALVGLGVFAYWFFQGRACTVTAEAAVVRASFFREDTVLPGYTLSVPINLRCSGFGHLATLWQVEGQTVAATATNLRLGSSGFSQELEPEKGVYAVDLTLSPINADEPGTLQELSFHFVSSNGYLDWLLNEKNMARFHKGRDVVVPVDVRVDYDPRRVTPLPFVYGGPVMTTESEAHRLRVGQWYQLSLDAPLTVGKLVMTTPCLTTGTKVE